jgi:ABC-2 type transport system permease protein
MSRIKQSLRKNKEALNTRTAKVGGYSFIMAVFVLAILIAVNVAVSSLPSKWTQFDISAARLYSVTSSTKVVAQNLSKDVTISWITQAGEEDTVLEKLLNVYDSLSDHISVRKVNPDIYPTFAAKYTDKTVQNNSLVVESGSRYRYIDYNDIYKTDTDKFYSTGSIAYSFDGEGAITTAIDYVTSEDLPLLYTLTGHGEKELSDSFAKGLEKQNFETASLTLLNVDEIPEDADGIIIYAPSSDLSAEEAAMLEDYLDNGGHLMVISGPQKEGSLTNLHSLLEKYNVAPQEGIVVEGTRSNYVFGTPYVLLPQIGKSEITSELAEENRYIVVPIAQGLKTGYYSTGYYSSKVTVTSLLTTTDASFSKIAGYNLESYEKEEGDIDGPFSVAVAIEDAGSGGSMLWISSDFIVDDLYNSYSSGTNADFVMNGVSWLIGKKESISIRSKSLDYNYLAISASQASTIKFFLIVLIPLIYLLLGVSDVWTRRKKA